MSSAADSLKKAAKGAVNAMTLGAFDDELNPEPEMPEPPEEPEEQPTAPVSDSKERERESLRRRQRRYAGRGRTGTVLSGGNNLG